ncbi:MAG TPA: 3-phosphoshikimate 1-carboxyvinyltransferase [Steroidobacteraceae bacterium]|nr:3-phosphoshikimate 1-carboxyvinyltransferase [Steroidobacteraceae bacterium]
MSAVVSYPSFIDLEPWQQGSFLFETPLPGSKSLTLRDCAIAALADGTSTIRYPGECDDYWRMKDCLKRLGFAVDDSGDGVVRITGRGGDFTGGDVSLDVGQSAVTTRLLLAIASLRPAVTVIDGHVSMQRRPNKDLVDALRALGATLESTNDGYLPTRVLGTRGLRGPARVPGTISSQYLTSLLTIAPLIDGGLVVEVDGDLTSKPYVDLTLDEMAKFGVVVENHDYRKLAVAPQAYRASAIDVEGDASAASYFAALAVLHGARITLTNLGTRTRQGDYAFLGLCEQLGARVTRNADSTVIEGPRTLDAAFAAPVDMTKMPDVAPTLMMIAPFLKTATRITGLATLRVKECDRIAAPTRELRKLGVDVEEGPDYMVIQPLGAAVRERRGVVEIETYHDHRIAMSFGVLGSRLPGLRILDPGCVAKTFPNYWKDWQRARGVPRGAA